MKEVKKNLGEKRTLLMTSKLSIKFALDSVFCYTVSPHPTLFWGGGGGVVLAMVEGS